MLLNFVSHFKINENTACFNNHEKASNTYCILILRQTDRRHILIFDFRFNYLMDNVSLSKFCDHKK